MLQPHEPLLIIAQSGRFIAQAAKRLGLTPLVIDCYGDVDTYDCAERVVTIADLSLNELAPALAQIKADNPTVKHVVYGSGFEYYPDSLAWLAQHYRLAGNSVTTFTRIYDKPNFFAVLSDLGIPFPETCFSEASLQRPGLLKPMLGQGGLGVVRAGQAQQVGQDKYWQAYQLGVCRTALFIADGKHAKVLGYNTQWCQATPEHEFLFAGIINSGGDLSVRQRRLVERWLVQLTLIFGLTGLNSVDFIQHGDELFVLEINPRLSASMQLYDERLLLNHIYGRVALSYRVRFAGYSAYQLLYASQDLVIPASCNWPVECRDIPKAGVKCRQGQPICSMIAHANTPEHVLNRLQQLSITLLTQLTQETQCNTTLASISTLNLS